METLKVLNRKKIKEILNTLKERYGFNGKLDYVFFINSKGKIFLLSKKFKDLDNSKLNINSLGLYFGTVNGKEIRLSVEGSQLIGDKSSKNIINLNDKELREWLTGEDLSFKNKENGFVLVKNEKDFCGCGKIVSNRLLNFVPKEKRVNII
ncbi:MAG: hypothetical protein KKG75_05755 [Nanoarchaeota archaeon]|nr:hypothetical protein [Nanoarchaeota archaeon]